ncbi:MAG: alpha/beta hydrolase [Lentisphaerae bacterium]|nr:alpha/beta hydrolase [Lentisphaerota bacterium]
MKATSAAALLLAATVGAAAAQGPLPVLRLWAGDAPGAKGQAPHDVPEVVPWLPDGPGPFPAIVVLPGGGYGALAPHEGPGYAGWLQTNGIAAFVVKYRLGPHGYRHPCMLQDAARAVRTVRAKASEWRVDPARIGIMGSSAGGHLASTALTRFDAGDPSSPDPVERQSSRPDFGVLCYAVISLKAPIGHVGSGRNLLGDNPDAALLDSLCNDSQVTKDTPPTFLWSLDKDPVVKVENSMAFAAALSRCGVPLEFHAYPGDKHGTGLKNYPVDESLHPWAPALLRWLSVRGVLRAPAAAVVP